MRPVSSFLAAIDARWKPAGGEPITLRLIGSAALMLQTGYERGTKDGDVLETESITPAVREQLLALAGPGSALFAEHRMYIEVVSRAILFCPQRPVFHRVPEPPLKNFTVEALDLTDLVVSKLKRMSQADARDIEALAGLGLLDQKRLVARFKSAVDRFSADARADDLPRCIENLNRVERDYLLAPESAIELPDWMG